MGRQSTIQRWNHSSICSDWLQEANDRMPCSFVEVEFLVVFFNGFLVSLFKVFGKYDVPVLTNGLHASLRGKSSDKYVRISTFSTDIATSTQANSCYAPE